MKNYNALKVLSVGKEKSLNQSPLFVEREVKAFHKGKLPIRVKGIGLKGTGILGYIKSYYQLKKIIKQEQPDIIHSHYSFSGVISILASSKRNVVVTFLGSDVFGKTLSLKLAKWFVFKYAAHVIVVSNRMLNTFPQHINISVIPQGIDVDSFKPLDKRKSTHHLGWDYNKINILFPSSKNRMEKNYALAKEAIQQLKLDFDIDFHSLEGVNPNKVPTYVNAADILLITSKWEGSSNITKEAMACNSIVVSTDVGDAFELFEGLEGYYITSNDVNDIKLKLTEALVFLEKKKSPKGRQRILELGLDDVTVAKSILEVYNQVNSEK